MGLDNKKNPYEHIHDKFSSELCQVCMFANVWREGYKKGFDDGRIDESKWSEGEGKKTYQQKEHENFFNSIFVHHFPNTKDTFKTILVDKDRPEC